MEQNFRTMVQETIKKDMQELLNGPIKQTHDIIAQVYEMGLMKGLEIQRKNLQFSFASNWINATDQLPDDGEKVIVAHRWVRGEVMYDSDVYHEDTGWEGYDNDDIIAWMPIPKLNN